MEIKIDGCIVESGKNGDSYYFIIKTEDDDYKANHCKIVPTTPEFMAKGCIFYSGMSLKRKDSFN